MSNRVALAVGSAAVVLVVAAVTLLGWRWLGPSSHDPSPAPAPAQIQAPARVAARVVDAMWSFDFTDAGPNVWVDKVRPDVTPEAYAYWRQGYGPGPGDTTTALWKQLVATDGHQTVTASNVHPDPASAKTNTSTHLTLMVPYALDVQGVSTPLVDADHLFYVNLDRPSTTAPWKVSDVLAPQSLMPGYGTETLQPVPKEGK